MSGRHLDDLGMEITRYEDEVDPAFAQFCTSLYGEAVDPREAWDRVSKNFGQSDVHVDHPLTVKQKKSQRRQARVALGSNVLGVTAGAAALAAAGKDERLDGSKAGRLVRTPYKAVTATRIGRKYGHLVAKPKVAGKLAAGAVALQAANLGGDIVANRVLNREAKKNVAKTEEIDLTWETTISKVDTEKRQVFGWASVTHVNGDPVVDKQNDYMPIEEIEKAAYSYLIFSRKGGDMHQQRDEQGNVVPDGQGVEPHHTADLIESMIFTPEKVAKMGLDPDTFPMYGWWVGMKINDDPTWELVKEGKRTGFSIHGKGKRTERDI